jgi:NAD(P)-dependent dehydrogenase (short-subunit alcohol dehydrogenase family)
MNASPWIDSPAPLLRLPDLAGGTALVTGASLGIGRATAIGLLENGATVFGLSRHRAEIDHPRFTSIPTDLRKMEDIRNALVTIGSATSSIDYVVNVAGADPKYLLGDVTEEDWDNLVDLNVRAYYFIIKYALPFLKEGAGKSIVNVSSINYRLGVPGRAAYSATKAAIVGLTAGLSRELGREKIRVNTVTPGWTFTERQIEEYFSGDTADKHLDFLEKAQAMKIKIRAEDISNHILFYLSHVSRASVAHNAVVDGGWLLE